MPNDECRMQNEARRTTLKGLAAFLLIGAGIWLWHLVFGEINSALFSFGSLGWRWLIVYLLICISAGAIPPIAAPLDRIIGRLRRTGPLVRGICSFAAVGGSIGYLLLTALTEHRQLYPYIHDEFSYLIQAHQLASGHLWMPAHALGQFFDSFQLLVTPVYASAYFPGTALLYVPGIWLHVPPFVTAVIITGFVAGLLFWITAELLDAVAGGLAVLLLLSDVVFRQASILVMGQMPLLLYVLLATAAWLRWRATPRTGWIILTGFFLGLAGITRPIDALCFAIPIGIAVLVKWPRSIFPMAAGALPLLLLQLILNHGVTGNWTRTPFGMYADRDYPGTSYGFHPYDPSARPASDLPQKQALYREYQPLLLEHQPGNILNDMLKPHGPFDGARLRLVLSQYTPTPFPMFVPLLFLPVLGLTRGRGVFVAALPLFVLFYVPYVFFFPHYVLAAAPCVIIGILTAARVLADRWKSTRRFYEVGLTLLIGGTAIAALPQWSPVNEDVFAAPLLGSVNKQLVQLPHLPAVVLFKYDPKRNTHEEPVFNADAASPDDALIIRAHDLGPANQDLFDYYANHQPQRYFYLFNEGDLSLIELGKATELRRK
jgi:hypothetical protein